jgi:hypothetical protein
MPPKRIFAASGAPEVSVIIPSFDGVRGGNVDILVNQLHEQTFKSIEIILSIGESPNGHARNVGYELARGKYLVLIDDDVTLGDEHVLQNILDPLKSRTDIGMTGPAQQIPPDANRFQFWSGAQIPRSLSPVVEEITDSDMVSHMCLAIPRDLFDEIGKESDWLLAGTDPDLRHRVRLAGLRVVVVPRCWAYHPAPESMGSLMRFAYKKGSFTAWQYRFARDLMYDCPDGHTGEFQAQTTLGFRVVRKVGRVLKELLTLRPLGVIFDLVYTFGYVHGLVRKWK